MRPTETSLRVFCAASVVLLSLVGGARSSPAARPAPTPVPPVGPRATAVPEKIASAVALEPVVSGLDRLVQLVAAPGRPRDLFLVELGGKILILRDGELLAEPFADLSSRVEQGHRAQGLLSLAFHPEFATTGRLYVNFTEKGSGDTQIVELRVADGDPDRVDPATERLLFSVPQPAPHHNGGDLQFGPDGRLYTAMGDGGVPRGGRGPRTLLGKLVRIDVDDPKAKPEELSKGLREPWRFSFDRRSGDLYVGDNGETARESLRVLSSGDLGGHDFGWPFFEGAQCRVRPQACGRFSFTLPTVEETHDWICSVIGGFVYRGAALPELDGTYFYADWCTGSVRSFRWTKEDGPRDHWEWRDALDPKSRLARLVSFGQDASGELYLLSHDGGVWKLVRKEKETGASDVKPAPASKDVSPQGSAR